jgi:RNA polymerase sigma factor (sigma-70 family)
MAGGQLTSVLTHLRRLIAGGDVPARSDADLLGLFLDRQDGDAFTQLVRRHGPMVWNVCVRVLHHTHDAEDAFQATFLVLARKARSIRKQPSLASWLYGVAYRTAVRTRNRRQQERERAMQLATNLTPNPLPGAGRGQGEGSADWLELRPILDEEVNQLPEKYRSPVVLCYLQGQTHEEAARELGWPKGTVAGRLARARDLLRARLARRGLAVTSTSMVLVIAQNAASATVPETLFVTVPPAALAFGAGATAAATAAAIAEGVLHTMLLAKLRIAAIVCVGVMLVALGGGTIAYKALAANDTTTRRNSGSGVALVDGAAGENEVVKPKLDQELLLGSWTVVKRGEHVSVGERVTFTPDRVLLHFGPSTTFSCKYAMDATKTPKTMDIHGAENGTGINPVDPYQAIYHLDGDDLQLAIGTPSERPKDFAAAEKAGRLAVLKREKPAAAKPDAELLLGTWVRISGGEAKEEQHAAGGEPLQPRAQVFDRLTFAKDTFTFWFEQTGHEYTWKIDPTKSPRELDLLSKAKGPGGREPEPTLCIYKLDGDTLEIALGTAFRPKEFAKAAPFGQHFVLKRQKGADDKPKTDEELIQGSWKWERRSEATDRLQDEQTYVFKGDRFWIVDRSGSEAGPFTFRLDASKTPKEIEVKGSAVLNGIYELGSSTLRLGFHTTPESLPPYGVGVPSAQARERPKDFTVAKAVRVFQRDAKPAATVLPLKHIEATRVAEFLGTIYPQAGGPPTFVADARTNSLLIQATPKQLEEIKQLLNKLDALGAKPDAVNPANPFVKEIIDPKLTLDLVAGQTRLVMLKQAPSRVMVGSEQVMSYNLISNTQVAVKGIAPGSTTWTLWFNVDGKEELLSYLVRVTDKDEKSGPGPLTARGRDIVKEMIQTAKTEQELRKQEFLTGRGSVDELYASSRRVAEAYGQDPTARKDFLTALEDHVKRMKEAEDIAKVRFDTGKITGQDLAAIKYHRLEAELWLEREKGKPKSQLDGRIDLQRLRVEQAEAVLAVKQERVTWSESMVKKGFLSQGELAAARTDLKAAEVNLAAAKQELDRLQGGHEPVAPVERKQ